MTHHSFHNAPPVNRSGSLYRHGAKPLEVFGFSQILVELQRDHSNDDQSVTRYMLLNPVQHVIIQTSPASTFLTSEGWYLGSRQDATDILVPKKK